ncbi:MAG: chemotaxis-specific protein-glutamate methyltransferase CheB [Acidobacteriota bacterium]
MTASAEPPASAEQAVRVAVVDDSTFIRKAILRMLDDEPMISVVGSAGSGEELLTHLDDWRPDVITLDLDMPGMGGLATLDRIMGRRPTPVIILSTHSGKGAPLTIEALHRGATDFIDKQQYSLVDFAALRAVLIERIFQVTDRVPVSEAEPAPPTAKSPPLSPVEPQTGASEAGEATTYAYDLIVIGASTGGPPTLQKILEDLGDSIPVPVVVVQHMPVGFTHAFAERLNAYLPLQVSEAHSMEHLLADSVYIAPAGAHLRISRQGSDLISETSTFPKGMPHMPSIDVLFDSAARTVGRRVIGALLTGMGRDGAQGMAAVKYRGGYTLCQDEKTCVVFGMPRAALALGAVREVASPDVMGRRIQQLLVNGPSEAPFLRRPSS